MLWIRIKYFNEKLDIKNIFDLVDKEIKGKFKDRPTKEQIKKYKTYGSEFIEGVKHIYAHEDIVMPVIMGARSPKAIRFRAKLGFTQYDITLKKDSSVLESIMETFEGKNMETQHSVLIFKVDLYFYDYKLTIEIDEKGHEDYEDSEKQRQKEIETELSCKFIRINPDEENFNISNDNNKIFRHIKESNKKLQKKSFIEKIPLRLLELEFKSNNSIKTKYLKWIVKKVLPKI